MNNPRGLVRNPWGPDLALAVPSGRQADLSLDRLLRLPLVPRDGARELRERSGSRAAERAFRQHQGRSRRAARPRSDLHERGADHDRARRLADVGVPHARPEAVLRRHLLAARRRGWACPASIRCSARWPTPGSAVGEEIEEHATNSTVQRRSSALAEPGRVATSCCSPQAGSAWSGVRLHPWRLRQGRRSSPTRWTCRCCSASGAANAKPSGWDMVKLNLDKMAQGGIYDHLAGGFARYSVDERVARAALRKMLYDNALLANALSRRLPGHRRRSVTPASCARRSTTSSAT
jgi:hypothetical protein